MNMLIGVNITSPLQLVCFVSYLRNSTECFDKVLLYTVDYWGGGQFYERYIDVLARFNIDIFHISSRKELFTSISINTRRSKNVTFVCVNEPCFQLKLLKINCKFVVISDGLGTYNDFSRKMVVLAKEKKIHKFSFGFLLIIAKQLMFSMCSMIINYECYMLYHKNTLKKDGLFSSSLKNTLKLFKTTKAGLERPSLIFLSQPLVQLGMVSEDDYMNCLDMAKKFADKEGLDFLIKLHPTEMKVFNALECGGVNRFCYDGIIEEACVNDENIRVIVSFFSSGLYISPELSNVKSYSVMSERLLCSLKLSRRQKSIIKTVPHI